MRQSFINHGRFVKELFVEERHLSTNMQSTTNNVVYQFTVLAKVMAVGMLLLFWVVTWPFPDLKLSIVSELVSDVHFKKIMKKNNFFHVFPSKMMLTTFKENRNTVNLHWRQKIRNAREISQRTGVPLHSCEQYVS